MIMWRCWCAHLCMIMWRCWCAHVCMIKRGCWCAQCVWLCEAVSIIHRCMLLWEHVGTLHTSMCLCVANTYYAHVHVITWRNYCCARVCVLVLQSLVAMVLISAPLWLNVGTKFTQASAVKKALAYYLVMYIFLKYFSILLLEQFVRKLIWAWIIILYTNISINCTQNCHLTQLFYLRCYLLWRHVSAPFDWAILRPYTFLDHINQ
jgi:hypothetical protein